MSSILSYVIIQLAFKCVKLKKFHFFLFLTNTLSRFEEEKEEVEKHKTKKFKIHTNYNMRIAIIYLNFTDKSQVFNFRKKNLKSLRTLS